MVINWYGEGCFKIQISGLTLLTDPFESNVGLTPPRGRSNITLKTLTAWPLKNTEKDGYVIRGAGEYEIQGITVQGFPLPACADRPAGKQEFFKTAYKVTIEDFTLGFLGHISNDLTAKALENLKNSDILFVPAGGKPFINQEAAAKLIKQINPKIVIASFFKVRGLKRASADWKTLANEMNQKPEALEKLTIKKKELSEQKGTKLVVLKI